MNVVRFTLVNAVLALLVVAPLRGADLWQVGTGKVIITPTKPMWMAVYASRSRPAEGKVTELWSKALVLDDGKGNRGVVISLDLVGIDRELAGKVCARLKQKFGIERRQIVICTSHTHSGPVVGRNLAPMHYYLLETDQQKLIDEYAARLVDHVERSVGQAIDSLAPSRVQWGSGRAAFAVNRRENRPYGSVPELRAKGELKGPVDHDVPVLSVRGEDGKLRAVLFGYACHATTLSFQKWNGDWPGYAQTAIEKAHPECTAIFWAGCGADQNPLPRRSVELAEHYGDELAKAVGDVLASPMTALSPSLSLRYRELELKLQQLPDAAALAKTTESKNPYEVARARMLQRRLEARGELEGAYPYPIGVWKLGETVDFVHLGGEVVVDYALRLKRELNGTKTWVAGNVNDVMAYIPSLRVHNEGGYEGGGANVYYGLPGIWNEGAEEALVRAVHEMLKDGS